MMPAGVSAVASPLAYLTAKPSYLLGLAIVVKLAEFESLATRPDPARQDGK
jgi:hypothetical protein